LKTQPATQQATDLIIIGAGAAGLSLLLALDEINYPYKVTLLERSAGPLNDRIWSFWDNTLDGVGNDNNIPNYIESIISHKWSKWTLSTSQRSYSMNNSVYRYCSVRSEDLSALAQKRNNENPNFNIIYSRNVTSIIDQNESCLVASQNEQLIASKVIDTRPPPIDKNHSGMLQCFYGEEIIVDTDVFEPSSVKLMHQLKCSELGIEFVYILPFSATHALVEFTCFSPTLISEDTLRTRLFEIINELVKPHKYLIQRNESAVLPMYVINKNIDNTDDKPPPINRNIIYGGIAGGAMRASTGYSFLNSQKWATQCASQLMYRNSFIKHAPINAIYRTMDLIMLNVLRDDMNIGVTIFEHMFKNVKPDSFARFMIQQATFLDLFSIIWAMPKSPFFKATCELMFVAKKRTHKKAVTRSD
jgi:lycopene beta-cyclase